MCSSELTGIYIHTLPAAQVGPYQKGDASPEANDKVSSGSSGIGSNTSSITSNIFSSMARKRNLSPDGRDFVDESVQLDSYEMEKIRRIMVDGDRRVSGGSIASSQRGSIEPSLMSTVFAVVLVIIISITVYAFASLYKAVRKRMNET